MPEISIFTPSHNPQFLDEVYESLLDQDFEDWEWIVLLNGKKTPIWKNPLDPRVRVSFSRHTDGIIGALKREAVSLCKAPFLVELDHDDTLEFNALSEVYRAFLAHPEASFVYSTFAQTKIHGRPDAQEYELRHGWTYRHDHGYRIPNIMQPTPHNVSLIWYAPNHVRAFTREAYDQTEGYDPTLVVLDDQDIMAKLYQVGEFIPIDEPLYFQRMFHGNTQHNPQLNRSIQLNTWTHYEKNILSLAKAWSFRKGLTVILDMDSDDVVELISAPVNSIGLIHMLRLNEFKTPDPMEIIELAWDKLAPNGMLLTLTPYFSRAVFEDYIDGTSPKFQVSRLQTVRIDNKPYLQANLIAIKPGYSRDGGVIG